MAFIIVRLIVSFSLKKFRRDFLEVACVKIFTIRLQVACYAYCSTKGREKSFTYRKKNYVSFSRRLFFWSAKFQRLSRAWGETRQEGLQGVFASCMCKQRKSGISRAEKQSNNAYDDARVGQLFSLNKADAF